MSERYMQELYACSRCGWWGADPCSHDWARESCHRDGCDGQMQRGTFVLASTEHITEEANR